MKPVLTILSLLLTLGLWASADDKEFLDADFNPIESVQGAKYYRTVSVIPDSLYYSEVYYLTDRPQMKAHFLDEELEILHGECIFYHRNGNIESQGEYVDGDRTGNWKRFTMFGERKLDHYYPAADEDRNDPYKTTLASFPDGSLGLAEFYNSELLFPIEAALVEIESGKVNVSLHLDENGKLIDFEILHYSSWFFVKEVERLMGIMPAWIPAYSNGEEVASYYIISIPFNREIPSDENQEKENSAVISEQNSSLELVEEK